ncbi:hypothetical protein K491DRAFT_459478 [Lophiostoma macrostomum CBS 122681]|uniref:Uncharacterized protein n=1 Tax=Lophiostoma macrostomum CBS 122681 TaxID=1314788 RepID=A0A6A6T713_9PLEO|nr:hypothetical protein K491DRAFT_459478 [Lophiostoma macrostomum CBS 122681]
MFLSSFGQLPTRSKSSRPPQPNPNHVQGPPTTTLHSIPLFSHSLRNREYHSLFRSQPSGFPCFNRFYKHPAHPFSRPSAICTTPNTFYLFSNPSKPLHNTCPTHPTVAFYVPQLHPIPHTNLPLATPDTISIPSHLIPTNPRSTNQPTRQSRPTVPYRRPPLSPTDHSYLIICFGYPAMPPLEYHHTSLHTYPCRKHTPCPGSHLRTGLHHPARQPESRTATATATATALGTHISRTYCVA